MICSRKLFYYYIQRLIKPRSCKKRLVHNGENVTPRKKAPFNSLEKIKWLSSEYDPKTPTRICLTIIGNGAVGQPRCLCMFTDCRSYMFNCGEGSARLTKEQEIDLQNLRQIFLTRKTWENIAGVVDIYLTHQTRGVPKITLHGPSGIEHLDSIISALKKSKIRIKSVEDSPYVDDIIEVEYVPFYRRNFKQPERPNINDSKSSAVISYICKIKDSPGEFLFQKCIDLGVPIGSHLLDLKNGNDVTLPSGKYVSASDVTSPRQPGFIFLVVDCQFETLIDDFVSEEKFKTYQSPSAEQEVIAVFHFSPQHIVRSYKYQQWISKFPKTTLHFLLNTSNPSPSSQVVHKTQNILNLLHQRIFPLLHEYPGKNISDVLEVNKNIIPAEAKLQLYLRPQVELDRTNVVNLCCEKDIDEANEIPNFTETVTALRKSIAKHEETILTGSDLYPEIIFLGTGSSVSTAYRNVTGILVNLSPDNSILLDCGEGIYSQLMRHFGYHNIVSVLKKISCIFLSHSHADHYMGIFRLLQARKEAFISSSEPYKQLAVMGVHTLDHQIKSFHRFFRPIYYDMRFFYNNMLTENKARDQLKEFLGDVRIFAVPVVHCSESYGVVLSSDNWKIVYSGDAAPSQTLIDAGKNCTLLIHEASIEDGFINEAANKLHSTPSQVVDIAEQMNAQHIILTHFSKRYLAVPLLPALKDASVGCAFDNMCVRLSDLPILPMFIPSLKCLFGETMEQHYDTAKVIVNLEKKFFKYAKV